MPFKKCAQCGSLTREIDPRCWKCGSDTFGEEGSLSRKPQEKTPSAQTRYGALDPSQKDRHPDIRITPATGGFEPPKRLTKGEIFEECVLALVEHMIETGELGLARGSCRAFHRKSYRSATGNSVQADVSVEVRQLAEKDPFLILIWECKNYSGKVGEEALKKFLADLQEIGVSKVKGIVATPQGFTRGAGRYAKKHGIGLWIVRMPREWNAYGDPRTIEHSTPLSSYTAESVGLLALVAIPLIFLVQITRFIREFFSDPFDTGTRW